MFGKEGSFLYRIRLFVTLMCCTTLVSAQNPGAVPPAITPTCTNLSDPGARPAGDFVVYSVSDDHGNVIPNFVQQDPTQQFLGAGSPLASFIGPTQLDAERLAFWEAGMAIFGDTASIKGAPPGVASTQPIVGLGPRFNGNSCVMCHSQPTIGGTSPGPGTPPSFSQNPQIPLAHFDSATNSVPSLNVTASLGVGGRFNRSGNDQSITRFGWKAQNPSLLMFAGEASNVEMGVTNELFPFERDAPENDGSNCTSNATPEDFTTPTSNTTQQIPNVVASDIEVLSFFMFGNIPPAQCDFGSGLNGNQPACKALTDAAKDGAVQFNRAGCNLCHTPTLHTGPSNFVDLNNVSFSPFSDFAIHHMGAQLSDGVIQGGATGDEFRTAPLWGVGQRFFFMHDGRSTNLLDAIEQHFTPTTQCTSFTSVGETFQLNGQSITVTPSTTQICGSEANAVIKRFFNQSILTCTQQEHVLEFLRSL